MLGIPVGLLVANATEWFTHKYVLHGLGSKKDSFWSFHWYEHHRNARRNEHIDAEYARGNWEWNAQTKELVSLVAMSLLPLPIAGRFPFFAATLWCSLANYYRVHRKSHTDPEWARSSLPWHYDHHMGPNQHANWCVTFPWFDHLMGTREHYVGTERERSDRERARRRTVEGSKVGNPSVVAQPKVALAG